MASNRATSKILQQQTTQIAAGQFEANFAARCWTYNSRSDGRHFNDLRGFSFSFDGDRGQVIVKIDKTSVMATVTASLGAPPSFSPRAGTFDISTRVVPVESQVDPRVLQQFLDRLFRSPTAPVLDVQQLCVVPGSVVWNVQVLVVVLADAGNVNDAATWACTAALSHFRRDEVAVTGDGAVRRFSAHERDPVPLSLLHQPLSFTFLVVPRAIYTGNDSINNATNFSEQAQSAASALSATGELVADPTSMEEQARTVSTTITVGVNGDGQVYFCHAAASTGGFSYDDTQRARQQAKLLCPLVLNVLKQTIDEDTAERKRELLAQFEWAQKRVGIRARD